MDGTVCALSQMQSVFQKWFSTFIFTKRRSTGVPEYGGESLRTPADICRTSTP